MRVIERRIGDLTILDLKGRITLGDGDELLKEAIARVVESGRRDIVLNLADVPFLDSAARGEIVRCLTTVSRAGGKLVLLNLTKRITDLLAITKLLTVFETYDSEFEAVSSFVGTKPTSVCPVCRHRAAFAATCLNCRAEFELTAVTAGASTKWIAQRIRIRTYEGEHVTLTPGDPYLITISGRLDLFSAEAMEQAWRTVPRPRRILVELGSDCRLVTTKGVNNVGALCKPQPDGGRTSVCYAGLAADLRTAVPAAPPFFSDRDAALAALGGAGDSGIIPIVVRDDADLR
jgi:anti-sigma B factor antagonist